MDEVEEMFRRLRRLRLVDGSGLTPKGLLALICLEAIVAEAGRRDGSDGPTTPIGTVRRRPA